MAGVKTGISGQVNNNIVTDGLVFYMDPAYKISYPGTGTTVTDTITSTISGSLESGIAFETNNNGIFSLDGVDDYIGVTTTNISDTTELTCNCWVKTSDITADGGSYRAFFATGPWQSGVTNAWKLSVNSINGKLDVWANAGSRLLSGTTLPTGEFVNVTYTYGSNTGKIYFNGSLSNSGTYTLTHYMGKIYLGAGGYNIATLTTQGMWNGNIGPVQFYNRALSAGEVLQNYQAQKERFGL
jgi:hypothetical protein